MYVHTYYLHVATSHSIDHQGTVPMIPVRGEILDLLVMYHLNLSYSLQIEIRTRKFKAEAKVATNEKARYV